jgi:hypothetical protein
VLQSALTASYDGLDRSLLHQRTIWNLTLPSLFSGYLSLLPFFMLPSSTLSMIDASTHFHSTYTFMNQSIVRIVRPLPGNLSLATFVHSLLPPSHLRSILLIGFGLLHSLGLLLIATPRHFTTSFALQLICIYASSFLDTHILGLTSLPDFRSFSYGFLSFLFDSHKIEFLVHALTSPSQYQSNVPSPRRLMGR